jgi:4-hydroxy-2-oxoheptanedioate aldolase
MRVPFRSLLARESAVGTWAQLPHPEAVEILAANGMDFVIVDTEHGHFGIETAAHMLRAADACGIAAVLRVPRPDPWLVSQALDLGASAVIAPSVESAEQARALLAAAHYAPAGTRGACPCTRSGGHWVRDWPRYAAQATEAVVIPLIETQAGAADIEAIAAVPGLAALMPGPFDLAVSMGLAGDWRDARVQQEVSAMLRAAAAHTVPAIMPVFAPTEAETASLAAAWRTQGVRHFTVGTDKILLSAAASRFAASVR